MTASIGDKRKQRRFDGAERSKRESRLAIDGGEPVRSSPWAPWPVFSEEQIAAVAEVLRSGRVNAWTGEQVRAFEAEYAEHLGARHAVATANGTLALELALEAIGLAEGDEVVTPSRTFVATASAVVRAGGRPVFADIDRCSQNLTAETASRALTPRTRAIVCVHLAGWPCDMDALRSLADRHGLWLIEDCAQAHEARWRDRPVGTWGDLAAFSFCQDKILTTGGEGGLVVMHDEDLYRRVWSLKDHGKAYDRAHEAARQPGAAFRWLHDSIGSNARMTEMQAALGRIALRCLPEQVAKRRELASALCGWLADIPGLRIEWPEGTPAFHSCYKLYAFVRPEALLPGWTRDRALAAIAAEGVPCASGACPEVYREAAFANLAGAADDSSGRRGGDIRAVADADGFQPTARELGETSLMFQTHPTLTLADMRDAACAVRKVMSAATGVWSAPP